MGLLFREHPKAQPGEGFCKSPGWNLRPLVYKASDLTTAPRMLLFVCLSDISNSVLVHFSCLKMPIISVVSQ